MSSIASKDKGLMFKLKRKPHRSVYRTGVLLRPRGREAGRVTFNFRPFTASVAQEREIYRILTAHQVRSSYSAHQEGLQVHFSDFSISGHYFRVMLAFQAVERLGPIFHRAPAGELQHASYS